MSKPTYSELLRDPRWQQKRLETLERAGWCCEVCGDSEKELHVHHLYYLKGKKPWEVERRQLSVMCKSCHKEAESCREWLLRTFSFAPPEMMMSFSHDLREAMDHPLTHWTEISAALRELLQSHEEMLRLQKQCYERARKKHLEETASK